MASSAMNRIVKAQSETESRQLPAVSDDPPASRLHTHCPMAPSAARRIAAMLGP